MNLADDPTDKKEEANTPELQEETVNAPEENVAEKTEEPAVEEKAEEPVTEEASKEEPAVEEKAEEPVAKEASKEEPAVEEKAEEPVAEETSKEEPAVEEKAEEPVAEEAPKEAPYKVSIANGNIQINPTETKKTEFGAGDNITIHYKIKEGNKERIQQFKGVVLQKRGTGTTETVTVRKVSGGVGVERIIPIRSPFIDKIEVNKRGKVRRARIFYLRNRKGKSARIEEKRS